jgi:hypothetical protein
VYVEGWPVREDIKSHYPSLSELLVVLIDEQSSETSSSKEQLMNLFRQLHIEVDGILAMTYPQMPLFGWELGDPDMRQKQVEEFRTVGDEIQRLQKKLEKIEKRKSFPSDKKKKLEERLYEAAEHGREMIKYEIGYPRSAEAYFYSSLDAEARHQFHPEESKNYAVVIGRGHTRDITEIALKQIERPTIKMYRCIGE